MTLELGQKLRIRTMVYIAGEPIPFFWPMRSFIHHNPLHGLEELPFHEAVQAGERLFHGRGFLPRSLYNSYLGEGRVDRNALEEGIAAFVARQASIPGIDLQRWLMTLLTRVDQPVALAGVLAGAGDVHAAIVNATSNGERPVDERAIADRLRGELLGDRPLYEAVDSLHGTE